MTQTTLAVSQFSGIKHSHVHSIRPNEISQSMHFGKQRLGHELVVYDRHDTSAVWVSPQQVVTK